MRQTRDGTTVSQRGDGAGFSVQRVRQWLERALWAALLLLTVAVGAYVLWGGDARGRVPLASRATFDDPIEPGERVRRDAEGNRLPEGALARLGTLRWRLGDWCSRLEYSPDDRRLLSIEGRRTVRVWDCADGRQICRATVADDWLERVAQSADGKFLAAAGHSGMVYVFDAETGRLRHKLPAHEESLWRSIRREARQRLGLAELAYYGWAAELAFSPDGATLYTVGGDGYLRAWDTAAGRQRWGEFGHTGGVSALAVSRDGQQIATGGYDGRVRLWNAAGQRVRQLERHEHEIFGLAFDEGGNRLTVLASKSLEVDDVDLNDGAVTSLSLNSLALKPIGDNWLDGLSTDGNRLLLARREPPQVELIDLRHPDGPRAIGRWPLNNRFAVTHAAPWRLARAIDGQVSEGPLAGESSLDASIGHTSYLSAIVESPDAAVLATCDYHGIVKLWDHRTWKQLRGFQFGDGEQRLGITTKFVAQPLLLAVGASAWLQPNETWPSRDPKPGESWRFLDITTGEQQRPWQGGVPDGDQWWCVGASADMGQLTLARLDEQAETPGGLRLAGFDTATKEATWQWSTPFTELFTVTQAAQGRLIVATGQTLGDEDKLISQMQVFDAQTENVAWSVELQAGESFRQVTRGGKFVSLSQRVAPTKEHREAPFINLRMLDLQTGQERLHVERIAADVSGRWGDNEDRLLAYCVPAKDDSTDQEGLLLLDLSADELRRRVDVPRLNRVESVFVSADGRRVAFDTKNSSKKEIDRWQAQVIDTATGRVIWQHRERGAQAAWAWIDLIDDDGELLVHNGAGTVLRIDPATGKERPALRGAGEAVTKCVLSYDRKLLLTADAGGHVGVWRRADGRRLHDYHGHRGAISILTILPDGRHIASGGADTSVVIWPLPAEK